jgi:serine/threonine protein kinase
MNHSSPTVGNSTKMSKFTPVEKPDEKEPTTVGVPEKLKSGKLFAWFELQRELDNGSTWLAQDYSVGRRVDQVALMFLPDFLVSDKAAIQELKNAIRRRTALKHPNILQVYDLVESKGGVAIQMEYCDGQSLSCLRLAKPNQVIEVGDLQKWAEQLCEALEYAHKDLGLIHGAIAPGNLLVDLAGNLKLKNFGVETSIAETVGRSMPIQQTSESLPFKSPQRAAGNEPGTSDDLYSLGATLFELLTGQPPARAGDIGLHPSGMASLSMTERRAALGMAGDVIPKNWEETVAACLAKDPAQRPQSAAEVQKRLQSVSGPTEIPARAKTRRSPKSTAKRRSPVSTSAPRKWWPTIVGIIFFFLVAVGSAIALFSFHLLTGPKPGKVISAANPISSPTPAALRSPVGKGNENFLAVPTGSAGKSRAPLDEASPTPAASSASPTPSLEANPNPSPDAGSTPPAEPIPAPSADASARVFSTLAATSNETPVPTPSPTPVNQNDTDATKDDVVRRINAMPGVTAEKKANLIAKMQRARSMERLAVIPFESGQSTLRRAATDDLVKMFDTSEMRDKLSDPTIVLVVAGYADSGGRPDHNLRISQARAESVGRILKEQAKLLNAMQTIGMGGTELLDSKRPDQNRAVEIWLVVPL